MKSILIIEDHSTILENLKMLFEFENFKPLCAEHPRAAEELLEKESVDFILCDYYFADTDATGFISLARERKIPIALITGSDIEEEKVEMAVFRKPLDINLIIAHIRESLVKE